MSENLEFSFPSQLLFGVFWGVPWMPVAMCICLSFAHPCEGKTLVLAPVETTVSKVFGMRCSTDHVCTSDGIFCVWSQRKAVFKNWILAPKGCFLVAFLGLGPIRRDGLFVLKRKRKCVFCSEGVPKIRLVRSVCFVHYMHVNICDRPKKLLSQERPFGHAMKFLHDRKTYFLLIFETLWGLGLACFADVSEVYFR